MYSICFSKIETGMPFIQEKLKKIISPNSKVAILPWAFPEELNSEKLMNEYFKVGEKRYNRYINALLSLEIKLENITICDCYKNPSELKKIIKQSNIIVLPGGNPEMMFQKILHDTELFYDLKHYKGIVIGESAGALLQFKRYFITAKNNFYKYFSFYDGFGLIDDPFYLDVHSSKNKFYEEKLKQVAKEKNKSIYALFDDGALIYNHDLKKIETFGNVRVFNPKE